MIGRLVPGHWEGDLVIGKGSRSAIGTLAERTTRLIVLVHLVVNRGAENPRHRLAETMSSLPAHLRRSLTWDQGTESRLRARRQESDVRGLRISKRPPGRAARGNAYTDYSRTDGPSNASTPPNEPAETPSRHGIGMPTTTITDPTTQSEAARLSAVESNCLGSRPRPAPTMP